MSYGKYALAVALIAGVSGCSSPAVIADLETDKVVVQTGLGTTEGDIIAKAREGCAIHGRTAEPISQVCLDQYCFRKNVLFACRE